MVVHEFRLSRRDEYILVILTIFYSLFRSSRIMNSGFVPLPMGMLTPVYALIGVYATFFCITHLKKVQFHFREIPYIVPLFVYAGYQLLSCVWTYNPFSAAQDWYANFVLLLLWLTVIRFSSQKSVVQILFWYISLSIVVSMITIYIGHPMAYVIDPNDSSESLTIIRPVGVFTFKTIAGTIMVISIASTISILFNEYKHFVSKMLFIFICISAVFILIACNGKAPLFGAFAAFLLVFLFTKTARGTNGKLWLALFMFLGAFLLWNYRVLYNLFLDFLHSQGKNLSFTGRTYIWQTYLEYGINNTPIFGSGYKGFRPFEVISGNFAQHAHNAYIQEFLEGGIVGLFLLLKALWRLLTKTLSFLPEGKWLPLFTVLMILITSMSEKLIQQNVLFFVLMTIKIAQGDTEDENSNTLNLLQ